MQNGTGRASIALWWGKFLVLMLIGCVGWGGALGQEDDDKDDDDRRGVQDFSLSVSPSTGSVVQGQSRTYTVELSSIDSDGIDDEISLTVSGLGTGVTGTFSGSLSSADTSTRLTVRASPSASLTRRGYTVTGTADNGLTREASAVVTVTARQPTSFSITPTPPADVAIGECYTIGAGNAANMTLDLQYTKDGGATQTITGWPTLDGSGEASACPNLAIQVGHYVFTAYRNTLASNWISSHEELIVVPERDFEVTVSPDHRTVYRGSSGTQTVHVTAINGFSSAVSLSVSGLPSGATPSLSRPSVTPTGTSMLTLTVGSSVPPGRYAYTVTGAGGGQTRTDTGYLVVPSFEVSVSPGFRERGSGVVADLCGDGDADRRLLDAGHAERLGSGVRPDGQFFAESGHPPGNRDFDADDPHQLQRLQGAGLVRRDRNRRRVHGQRFGRRGGPGLLGVQLHGEPESATARLSRLHGRRGFGFWVPGFRPAEHLGAAHGGDAHLFPQPHSFDLPAQADGRSDSTSGATHLHRDGGGPWMHGR